MVTSATQVHLFHRSLCNEHLEEGAFAWTARERAVGPSSLALKQIGDLDSAVVAHIDGLRVAGYSTWADCSAVVTPEESGELFMAGVLAIEAQSPGRLETWLSLFDQCATLSTGA